MRLVEPSKCGGQGTPLPCYLLHRPPQTPYPFIPSFPPNTEGVEAEVSGAQGPLHLCDKSDKEPVEHVSENGTV